MKGDAQSASAAACRQDIIQKLRCASAVDYRIAASVAHRYESHGQPLWSSLSRLLGLSQLCAGEGKAG